MTLARIQFNLLFIRDTQQLGKGLLRYGITRLLSVEIDLATIARLADTSLEMVIKNYLAARDNIDLPSL